MKNYETELAEIIKAQTTEYTEQDIDNMYQEYLQRTNISNPMKLHGAI